VTVEEWGKVSSYANRILLPEGAVPLTAWYEVLQPAGAEVVGVWEAQHYREKPGLTLRKVGRGRAYYLGTYLSEESFAPLLDGLAAAAEVGPLVEGLPENVEVVERTDGQKRLLFLLNHSPEPVALVGVPPGRELLADSQVTGRVELEGFGVALIHREG
ncbi:MAG: beta-galactosidase trimerization domain-containing protein, partial [Armatimonadota bacterium]|nr:beta-galactosidase trimerization domain-containing protein [Armatimonadota bacterium]